MQNENASDLQQVKILLVDDREENLISLESLLQSDDENYTYIFATSGEEALKIAFQEELALILLDVQMPQMNGYEVAQYLRGNSRTKDVSIIFITAIDEDASHMVEGFEAGAVDFLFKPLHPYITKAKVSTFVKFYQQKKVLEKANQIILNSNRQLEDKVAERTKELVRINNDLENFIYTASHDLKAPINNIEGLMDLLNELLAETEIENVGPILGMVTKSIDRFKKTLEDLTEVAKAQNEEVTDNDKVNFDVLLEDVKLGINDLIRESNASIISDFSQAPEIFFSRKNLRSIIYNLLSNAIRYRSPDRKPIIRVTSFTEDNFIAFSVKDNGLGIKREDQPKIFGMFKRLHNHVEGTGVGMAIVKRIIENSGGKIELESEVEEGSTFTVYLKN